MNDLRQQEGIKTYGALLIPLDNAEENVAEVVVNPKEATKQEGKIKSALKKASNIVKTQVSNYFPSVDKTISDLVSYMKDENNSVNDKIGVIGSKFSGIAITQLLIDGKITNKSARDYLFLGFAPQLGALGVEFGYSGLTQMKNALANGNINVGQLLSGFKKILKAGTDLKNQVANKDRSQLYNIIEFDLTSSHTETYTSETPDRRVQSGISYSEVVHNLPETIDITCSLQDGKRYTAYQFREIITNLRNDKKLVRLVLGDEDFGDLILTGFTPNTDCTKSGFDYNLSFKRINIGEVDVSAEVTIQPMPTIVTDTIGGLGGSGNGVPPIYNPDNKNPDNKNAPTKNVSLLKRLGISINEFFGIFQ